VAPIPINIKQLGAFAGLINYYGKFPPQIATHMAPLYEKDCNWEWTDDCNLAFLKCKAMLTCDAALVHYDSAKPIKLACGAFSYGLGAVYVMTVSIQYHL